jgi:hypothetical protein
MPRLLNRILPADQGCTLHRIWHPDAHEDYPQRLLRPTGRSTGRAVPCGLTPRIREGWRWPSGRSCTGEVHEGNAQYRVARILFDLGRHKEALEAMLQAPHPEEGTGEEHHDTDAHHWVARTLR